MHFPVRTDMRADPSAYGLLQQLKAATSGNPTFEFFLIYPDGEISERVVLHGDSPFDDEHLLVCVEQHHSEVTGGHRPKVRWERLTMVRSFSFEAPDGEEAPEE